MCDLLWDYIVYVDTVNRNQYLVDTVWLICVVFTSNTKTNTYRVPVHHHSFGVTEHHDHLGLEGDDQHGALLHHLAHDQLEVRCKHRTWDRPPGQGTASQGCIKDHPHNLHCWGLRLTLHLD